MKAEAENRKDQHGPCGTTWLLYSNVKRWFDAINARPAVQRCVQMLKEVQAANQAPHEEKAWAITFGKTQFQRR